MSEIWKDIKDYEDNYQVSNFGNIRSKERKAPTKNPDVMRTIKAQERKTFHNKKGYKTVVLTKDNKSKTFTVHQLVAQAFLPDFIKGMTINHIDGVKDNNLITNLELSNNQHNQLHAVKYGLRAKKSSSKYHNVFYIKNPRAVKKWASSINHNGKSIGFKSFHTEEEAAKHADFLLESVGDTYRLRNFP